MRDTRRETEVLNFVAPSLILSCMFDLVDRNGGGAQEEYGELRSGPSSSCSSDNVVFPIPSGKLPLKAKSWKYMSVLAGMNVSTSPIN